MENKPQLTTLSLKLIPLKAIQMSSFQARTLFEEKELNSLADSIKKHGILQPILVTEKSGSYQLIAGERRVRASLKAGMQSISARVIQGSDAQHIEIGLRENLDRQDLHPIEEGEGYELLLKNHIYTTHEAIANSFGKPRSRVTECISFNQLHPDVKQRLIKEQVTTRYLLRKLSRTQKDNQLELLNKELDKEIDKDEKQNYIKKEVNKAKPFKYQFKNDKFTMSSFKWIKDQNRDDLKTFIHSVKNIIQELEIFIK